MRTLNRSIKFIPMRLKPFKSDTCMDVSPLSANHTKRLNTLKQEMLLQPTNCLSVFDHIVGLALKGLAYNNELYYQFSHSFQNITKFNKIKFLIKVLNNYGLMVLVFRLLLLLLLNIMSQTFFFLSSTKAVNSPLFQSKFYRHSS